MLWLRTLAVIFLVISLAGADELRTLGSKTLTGSVTAVTDKDITIKTDAGPVSTPLNQVLALNLNESKGISADKYLDVRLLDDNVLHCTKIDFKAKEVSLTLASGISLTLPLTYVLSIVREAQDPQLLKKWDVLARANVKQDRIVILKEGELNALEGTLGEIDQDGKTVKFQRDTGEIVPVALEKLHGIIFYRLEAPPEKLLCRVFDTQGSVLAALKLGFDGKDYVVTTPFGAKIALAPADLARFDFNMGKLTYLSDMEPAKVVEKSGAGLVNHYRKDVNLDGEPIFLEKAHAKGLSLHAYTELEYNLAGKYKSFKATLGVDARVGAESQALVSIVCDGDKRFSEVVTAKAVKELSLNVKDVTTLRIVVSSRNFLDLHDHATLADARVSQ
jgi:hypothetical protein